MANKKTNSVVNLLGEIVELLPNCLYKVRLENGHLTVGHLSGKMKASTDKILFGDKVKIQMTPFDLTKCRIDSVSI